MHHNCSEVIQPINSTHSLNDTTWCNWAPFGKSGASHSYPRLLPIQAREGLLAGGDLSLSTWSLVDMWPSAAEA